VKLRPSEEVRVRVVFGKRVKSLPALKVLLLQLPQSDSLYLPGKLKEAVAVPGANVTVSPESSTLNVRVIFAVSFVPRLVALIGVVVVMVKFAPSVVSTLTGTPVGVAAAMKSNVSYEGRDLHPLLAHETSVF